MSPPVKSLRQRIDAAPTTKWAAITALVTFLGTSGGFKIIDRLAPRTGERLGQIELTLKLQERNLESLTRAMWRAGVKVTTNEVPQ
jgi:hypothetical protein